MKSTKLIATATFAVIVLAFAGSVRAGGKGGGGHGASAHAAGHTGSRNGMGNRWGRGFRRGVVNGSFGSSYYGYGGYGGYGNEIVENDDEADWSEQWASIYEDNDGPYARSTRETSSGPARMWVFTDKDGDSTTSSSPNTSSSGK
jgi:hypothetical protein